MIDGIGHQNKTAHAPRKPSSAPATTAGTTTTATAPVPTIRIHHYIYVTLVYDARLLIQLYTAAGGFWSYL